MNCEASPQPATPRSLEFGGFRHSGEWLLTCDQRLCRLRCNSYMRWVIVSENWGNPKSSLPPIRGWRAIRGASGLRTARKCRPPCRVTPRFRSALLSADTDLPNRDHVLDLILDQTWGSPCQSDTVCDILADIKHSTCSITKITSASIIYKSNRYFHVLLYAICFCIVNGVCVG